MLLTPSALPARRAASGASHDPRDELPRLGSAFPTDRGVGAEVVRGDSMAAELKSQRLEVTLERLPALEIGRDEIESARCLGVSSGVERSRRDVIGVDGRSKGASTPEERRASANTTANAERRIVDIAWVYTSFVEEIAADTYSNVVEYAKSERLLFGRNWDLSIRISLYLI